MITKTHALLVTLFCSLLASCYSDVHVDNQINFDKKYLYGTWTSQKTADVDNQKEFNIRKDVADAYEFYLAESTANIYNKNNQTSYCIDNQPYELSRGYIILLPTEECDQIEFKIHSFSKDHVIVLDEVNEDGTMIRTWFEKS